MCPLVPKIGAHPLKLTFWNKAVAQQNFGSFGSPLEAMAIRPNGSHRRLLMPLVASLLLVAMPFVTSSFLLLLVRHLLLEAMHLLLVASGSHRRP